VRTRGNVEIETRREVRTWRKRKGLATKLLGNPASSTSAHVTTGFATGHAAPSSFEIPHCKPRKAKLNAIEDGPLDAPSGAEEGEWDYVFDGLEGEGGVADEYASRPGALAVGAAAAGGWRVREAGGEGAGEGRGDEG
jgi:hypothetical protein